MMDARQAARLLDGDQISRDTVSCPGPGHDRGDRSLSVRFMADGSFVVHSFAGDDFRECRDHVAELLGLPGFEPGTGTARRPVERPRPATSDAGDDIAKRIGWARQVWLQSVPIPGTPAEAYLKSRGLLLEEDLSEVLRFHGALRYGDTKVPGMVALLRDVPSELACGIHRTFLTPEGNKLDRRMLGRAKDAAIMVDDPEEVTLGLHLAEGIETALSARQLGYRPCWALGSAGAIAGFPVLRGIDAVTVFTENDEASTRAADAMCERYEAAGIEAFTVEPPAGDMNDFTRAAS
jgi:putative DNA primase/helicase